MRQYDDVGPAGNPLLGHERAAQRGAHAQRGEEVRLHPRSRRQVGSVPPVRQEDAGRLQRGDLVEGPRLRNEVLHVQHVDAGEVLEPCLLVVPLPVREGGADGHEPLGLGVGERPEHHAVHDAEDRARGTDPEPERECHATGEARPAHEAAHREPEVLQPSRRHRPHPPVQVVISISGARVRRPARPVYDPGSAAPQHRAPKPPASAALSHTTQIRDPPLTQIPHHELTRVSAHEEPQENPVDEREADHPSAPPTIDRSFGRSPSDMDRSTSTERLSSSAPVGSSR